MFLIVLILGGGRGGGACIQATPPKAKQRGARKAHNSPHMVEVLALALPSRTFFSFW